MHIPNKAHRSCDSDPIKNTHPHFKLRLVDREAVKTSTQMNACQREDRLLDCDPVNGFFKGLLLLLPCSILLWTIAIWGVRSLIY